MIQKLSKDINIIFPVFPLSEIEKQLLWETVDGQPLFYLSIKNLINIRNTNLCIITDQHEVIEYLTGNKITCYYKEMSSDSSDVSFCNVAFHSASYLLSLNIGFPDSVIVVIDYKNPLISNEVIQKALIQYDESDYPVLTSIAEDRDHPSQFFLFYKILDTDLICLLDSNDSFTMERKTDYSDNELKILNDDFTTLYAFYFDWKAYGVKNVGHRRLFYKKTDSGYPVFYEIETDHIVKSSILYLYYQDEYNAVRFVPKKDLLLRDKQLLAGFSCLRQPDMSGCLLIRNMENNGINLYVNSYLYHDHLIIRKWALNKEHKAFDSSDIELSSTGELEYLYFMESTFIGPFNFHTDDADINSFVLSLLSPVNEEECADFSEPMETDNHLWAYNPETKRPVNCETGKDILGRQDFPETYIKDHSFCIFREKDMNALTDLKNKKYSGFILEKTNTLKVKNQIDILKLKITMNLI